METKQQVQPYTVWLVMQTGVIVLAFITALLNLPMGLDNIDRVLGKGGAKVSTSMKMEGMAMKDMSEHYGDTMQMKMDSMSEQSDNKTEMNMKTNVTSKTKIFVAILSIIILAIGIYAANYWGNFSMKPKGEMNNMKMK